MVDRWARRRGGLGGGGTAPGCRSPAGSAVAVVAGGDMATPHPAPHPRGAGAAGPCRGLPGLPSGRLSCGTHRTRAAAESQAPRPPGQAPGAWPGVLLGSAELTAGPTLLHRLLNNYKGLFRLHCGGKQSSRRPGRQPGAARWGPRAAFKSRPPAALRLIAPRGNKGAGASNLPGKQCSSYVTI